MATDPCNALERIIRIRAGQRDLNEDGETKNTHAIITKLHAMHTTTHETKLRMQCSPMTTTTFDDYIRMINNSEFNTSVVDFNALFQQHISVCEQIAGFEYNAEDRLLLNDCTEYEDEVVQAREKKSASAAALQLSSMQSKSNPRYSQLQKQVMNEKKQAESVDYTSDTAIIGKKKKKPKTIYQITDLNVSYYPTHIEDDSIYIKHCRKQYQKMKLLKTGIGIEISFGTFILNLTSATHI
jgi:hypothetical protein